MSERYSRAAPQRIVPEISSRFAKRKNPFDHYGEECVSHRSRALATEHNEVKSMRVHGLIHPIFHIRWLRASSTFWIRVPRRGLRFRWWSGLWLAVERALSERFSCLFIKSPLLISIADNYAATVLGAQIAVSHWWSSAEKRSQQFADQTQRDR